MWKTTGVVVWSMGRFFAVKENGREDPGERTGERAFRLARIGNSSTVDGIMAHIAVIGAGVAGLTAAYGLRGLPLDVTVFEKSRGFGGRAATRGRYGCRYDHGASYFTAPSDRVEELVRVHLPTHGLMKIGRPIWTFDEKGELIRPTSPYETSPKWTYRQGISRLGKLLAHFSRATVRTQREVDRLAYDGAQWTVRTKQGESFSPFDAVVLTPPAPQTARLLAVSAVKGERVKRVQRAVEKINYTSQYSFIFTFDRPVSRPGGFYGLANDEGNHPLQWIAFENDKPGHVRRGHNMIIVQTAPEWTADHLEEDPVRFVGDVKEMTEDILVSDLRYPAWYDVQRWRYARPTSALSNDTLSVGTSLGLFLAGDYVCGVGRVGTALETGFDVACRVDNFL